jgi:hypothetical protein
LGSVADFSRPSALPAIANPQISAHITAKLRFIRVIALSPRKENYLAHRIMSFPRPFWESEHSTPLAGDADQPSTVVLNEAGRFFLPSRSCGTSACAVKTASSPNVWHEADLPALPLSLR